MIGYASQSILGPFLFSEIKDNNISDTVSGAIFEVTPLIAALASPLIGMVLSKAGRKKVTLLSGSLHVPKKMASRVLCFTPITYLSKDAFIFATISSRILKGLGAAWSSISGFALISSVY